MSERVFSYDDTFAAMCLIEEVIDPNLGDAGAPWEAYRETWGINGLRDVIINQLANACDQAWNKAQAAQEADPELPDIGSFDYEFVPRWIRLNVDWSDLNNGPRVRGAHVGYQHGEIGRAT